jgi:hypothetical protein
MTLTLLVPLITALGAGSVVGALVQSRLERQKHLNEQEHDLKRRRYMCILILLLSKLEPKTSLPHLALHRPDLQGLDDLDAEIRLELFNAMLFANDEVIAGMADFIANAGYPAYIRTVTAMRRDLWNKKTAIDEAALSRATQGFSLDLNSTRG